MSVRLVTMPLPGARLVLLRPSGEVTLDVRVLHLVGGQTHHLVDAAFDAETGTLYADATEDIPQMSEVLERLSKAPEWWETV